MRYDIGDAILQTLNSPNESDRNGEDANVVDGLFAIARALNRIAVALDGGRVKTSPGTPHKNEPFY